MILLRKWYQLMDNYTYSRSENIFENFDSIHSEFFFRESTSDIDKSKTTEEKPMITFGYNSPPSLNNINYFTKGNEVYYSLLSIINEIGALPNNWNDNGAEQFTFDIILRSQGFLSKIDKILPNVHIFPTASESIQFEWEVNNLYCEVEIKSHTFKLYAEKNGDKISEKEFLNINDASSEFVDLYPT